MYQEYIDVYIKTNFSRVNDDSHIFLTINGKHMLVRKQLKLNNPIHIKVKRYKEYFIELSDDRETYKELLLKDIEDSTISIYSRKANPLLGFRGKLFEVLSSPFLKRFTFKVKIKK